MGDNNGALKGDIKVEGNISQDSNTCKQKTEEATSMIQLTHLDITDTSAGK